jgi:DNA gyrase/topoisomerase IV subunit A
MSKLGAYGIKLKYQNPKNKWLLYIQKHFGPFHKKKPNVIFSKIIKHLAKRWNNKKQGIKKPKYKSKPKTKLNKTKDYIPIKGRNKGSLTYQQIRDLKKLEKERIDRELIDLDTGIKDYEDFEDYEEYLNEMNRNEMGDGLKKTKRKRKTKKGGLNLEDVTTFFKMIPRALNVAFNPFSKERQKMAEEGYFSKLRKK